MNQEEQIRQLIELANSLQARNSDLSDQVFKLQAQITEMRGQQMPKAAAFGGDAEKALLASLNEPEKPPTQSSWGSKPQ